ncbi:MAG TPA: NAD(P)H-dependent oxidoreductase [Solirubrobacteraceae bacterium]|jgi:FMN reductase|nr:NAD(P)H-dependent oxidoreductase [Solirubrobacteraceae bacterium]
MSSIATRGARPLIVGVGGTERDGSVTEACVREALHAAELEGARVVLFGAAALDLPMFKPTVTRRSTRVANLVGAIRECNGLVLGSPAYHGGLSGLVKNALDYLEDLHDDPRPYLDGRAVGCIACAYGDQSTATTLTSLRNIVHALRGWPTPLGVTVSSGSAVARDGTIADQRIRERLHLLGRQVMDFAHAQAACA